MRWRRNKLKPERGAEQQRRWNAGRPPGTQAAFQAVHHGRKDPERAAEQQRQWKAAHRGRKLEEDPKRAAE